MPILSIGGALVESPPTKSETIQATFPRSFKTTSKSQLSDFAKSAGRVFSEFFPNGQGDRPQRATTRGEPTNTAISRGKDYGLPNLSIARCGGWQPNTSAKFAIRGGVIARGFARQNSDREFDLSVSNGSCVYKVLAHLPSTWSEPGGKESGASPRRRPPRPLPRWPGFFPVTPSNLRSRQKPSNSVCVPTTKTAP